MNLIQSANNCKTLQGEVYRDYTNNPIDHPIGMMDRGNCSVDVVTDMSHLENEALAKLLLYVNDNAVNSFLHEIRLIITKGP